MVNKDEYKLVFLRTDQYLFTHLFTYLLIYLFLSATIFVHYKNSRLLAYKMINIRRNNSLLVLQTS